MIENSTFPLALTVII